MLRGLDIRDMLLIDRLELEFQPGLNALTGETGAGKSILLDSLGFVLGWRGRADLVRQGAERGEVTAVFDLAHDHPGHAILEEAGIEVEEDVVIRRVNGTDGRKTAWINDRRASGEILRRLSATLVELHGQHDDRGLLDPRGHRALLDAFADDAELVARVAAAWRKRAEAARAYDRALAQLDTLRAEEEFLRHAVGEIEALAPETGEDASLDARRRQMQSGQKIREDIARALEMLGSGGAEGPMLDAARWLDAAAHHAEGRLDAPIEALARAVDALAEAEQGTAAALDALDFDPFELEQIEERLFAIRALARKHDVLPDDLAGLGETLGERLRALDDGDRDLAQLRASVEQGDRDYDAAARALSEARKEAAGRLDRAMQAELAPLKMDRAVFTTQVTPADPGPSGRDQVEFAVATNPGAPAGSLGKIASGGELSRFLLALKVCLTEAQSSLTLIFDEIDRGVGGATADAVGRRLAALSEGAQVLVVTHSPQVAARAQHHWRVEKRVDGEMTTTSVVPLVPADRVDEIARMLAGDRVTDEARGAARALLAAG